MRIRCTSGPITGEVFSIQEGESYILGRDPSSESGQPIALPSKTVSRNHCQIKFSNGELQVIDLKSSNGIRINRQKMARGVLEKGDTLDIGEFSFVVEAESKTKTHRQNQEPEESYSASATSGTEAEKYAREVTSRMSPAVKKLVDRFDRLDLKKKVLIALMLGGMISHWLITAPAISDARKSLLSQSFEIARKAARSLGDRNKRELAEGSNFLLDCDFLKGSPGVEKVFLLDARGKVVCPIGADIAQDSLTEAALYRGETVDDCRERITEEGLDNCDLVFPVREWRDQQAQYVTVGVSRVRYQPHDAFLTLQNLQTLGWKTLALSLLILVGIWWLWQKWQEKAVFLASEGVHLAVSGTATNVEKIESFAGLDPLVDEINRLISKSNQAVSSNSSLGTGEASFLHLLLQQVLLLEERAVMVVDRDNHMIAASASLAAAIPVNVENLNVHVTDAVSDTHLQGELISFLNDLSVSNEVLDRALSLSDRVVQARGMPLFLRDDYVASILIF
ncbi:MAG: FHA domain-containing protein [Deltaproteobacteria bacterium]|nr:FHA domain-containing protein [Deltaproteobacteria bacterium]